MTLADTSSSCSSTSCSYSFSSVRIGNLSEILPIRRRKSRRSWQPRCNREMPGSLGISPAPLSLTNFIRHFFVSYVILQGKQRLFQWLIMIERMGVGVGLQPLQLLNLGVIIPRLFYRMFITRTPRGRYFDKSDTWVALTMRMQIMPSSTPRR